MKNYILYLKSREELQEVISFLNENFSNVELVDTSKDSVEFFDSKEEYDEYIQDMYDHPVINFDSENLNRMMVENMLIDRFDSIDCIDYFEF